MFAFLTSLAFYGAGIVLAVAALPTFVALAVYPRAAMEIAVTTATYWRALAYYARGGSYAECPFFRDPAELQARVHTHSLWLIFFLWDKPHYRNGTFRDDMAKNLRNVAVPGTGLALSHVVAAGRAATAAYVLLGYPLVALVAAINHARNVRLGLADKEEPAVSTAAAFRAQLLHPQDWFSFWRLNCRLASYHALVTGETGYECEDKWTFLTRCEAGGIPISPCLKLPGLVVKHRNEEGGLGFHAFANATVGGDWIIQEALHNADWLASMLPKVAPLSTMRVITRSVGGLNSPVSRGDIDVDRALADGSLVDVCSCVLRAGRSGAITDHVSILFDVDPWTGVIKRGTTNAHWYQLGAAAPLTTAWSSTHDTVDHPDNGVRWTGTPIPDFAAAVELVKKAHLTLSPGVPLIGWDVAFTTKGVCLLEANYSCNFFRGTFDKAAYFRTVDQYLANLEGRRSAGKAAYDVNKVVAEDGKTNLA